jgi:hypothetical protein
MRDDGVTIWMRLDHAEWTNYLRIDPRV